MTTEAQYGGRCRLKPEGVCGSWWRMPGAMRKTRELEEKAEVADKRGQCTQLLTRDESTGINRFRFRLYRHSRRPYSLQELVSRWSKTYGTMHE